MSKTLVTCQPYSGDFPTLNFFFRDTCIFFVANQYGRKEITVYTDMVMDPTGDAEPEQYDDNKRAWTCMISNGKNYIFLNRNARDDNLTFGSLGEVSNSVKTYMHISLTEQQSQKIYEDIMLTLHSHFEPIDRLITRVKPSNSFFEYDCKKTLYTVKSLVMVHAFIC